MSGVRLGVNIDHAATLRQVRGGTTAYPNLLELTQTIKDSGGEQITVHLREDRRHIQLHDLVTLTEKCPLPVNLEMAPTDVMAKLAKRYKPDWCCFVPEKRKELTTEGGLDVVKGKKNIQKLVERLQNVGIEISMFIEPSLQQVKASYEVGADAIELHTGRWVRLRGPAKEKEWKRLVVAAEAAHKLNLSVHAGHGLDFDSAAEIVKLPHLREVNIGHSLICYSLEMGLGEAVKRMKRLLL